MKPSVWHGCYDQSWQGWITPESFAHPAKFSRGLIVRLVDYCLHRRWLKPGDTVGDPFAGIGTGGLVCAYRRIAWVGVELEPKFVWLALGNFLQHKRFLGPWGMPLPVIQQGDSRQFDQIVDAVITSPPYAHIAAGAGGLNTQPAKRPGQQTGRNPNNASQAARIQDRGIARYGSTAGQIAGLQDGSVEGVITSPPWEKNAEGSRKAGKFRDTKAVLKCSRGHGATDAAVLAQAERDAHKVYGDSAGQIGQAAGQTYWQAMDQVYRACFAAIKPGGFIAVVVKDYVKNRQRVRLCDQTQALLEHIGFLPLERIHASLVTETRHADLFQGESVTRKSRKSFFRRLAEAKGSPAIDYEEILFLKKPL